MRRKQGVNLVNDSVTAGDREPLWTPLIAAALIIVVLLAVGVRVAWIAYANVNPNDGRFDDTVFYFNSAKSLAQHFTYRDQYGRYSAHWPPGYPLVLSGVFATAGTHLLAAKTLNVAVSAATVVLTYVLGARAFGVRAGLLGAMLLALAPGHAYFSSLVMSEVLFTFGFLAVVAMLVWWTIDVAPVSWRWLFLDPHDPAIAASTFSRNQEPRMLALGVATGCLTLVRSEAVFLPAVFIALWLVMLPRWRAVLWHIAIFGAGFVLALTPWTVRNYVRFHELLPLRDGTHGALSAALDRNYPHRTEPYTPPPIADTAGYMARHPWELAPLQIAKLRRLYRNDSGGVEWVQQLLTPREVQRWTHVADRYFFAIGVGALLAAPLLLRAPDRRRATLVYMIAAWTAIEIIGWPEARYHLPVEPLVCMFAAWAAVSAGGAVLAARDHTQ
jgi:4-amino-4-deoxy-L-arabinose transferase-like glycosyltransferase